ncbi:hypothetical protein MRX96_032145 [Rhipicephalus microplus]
MSALKNTSNQEGRNDISLRPQKYTFMLRTLDSNFKKTAFFALMMNRFASDKRPEKCLLQYDSGVCEEFKPSTVWLYSTTYGACMPLTYYGCMRKENWLSSCEECKKECKSDVCAEEDLEPRGEK